jgi:NAD(P)-dependent dehydrogenase (short-subunit alcohol dehydrogenase family)
VTGAASGIGRASAQAFAQSGASLVVCDLDVAGGQETVRAIREAGGQAIFERANVAEPADVECLIATAVEHFGRLDCAHNNAGVLGVAARMAELSDAAWQQALSVNLTGVFLCMRAELRQMLAHGRGAIVNTASASGLVGTPGLAAYAAAKHGVVGLTKSAAIEYATEGIRVNAICPGATETPMLAAAAGTPELIQHTLSQQPIGRIAAPREVAEVAVWLCSDRASFVTGAAVPVDGGMVAH